MKAAPSSFIVFSLILLLLIIMIGVFEAIPMDVIGLPIVVFAYGFIVYSIYFVFKNRYSLRFVWAVAFLFLPIIGHLIFWILYRQKTE
jgi:hypothetical protein